jgi:hypothetical protein
MKADKNCVIDHINGNTMDCRKMNLRSCTHGENLRNRKVKENNKSGVTGVFWNNYIPTPKWMAYIKLNYKFINLGYYDDKEDAIKARKEAEQKYFGEFVRKK